MQCNKNKFKYQYKKSSKKSKGDILFIHGFATQANSHWPFQRLITDYDYYALELPGNGSIEFPKGSKVNFSFYVNYILEFIKEMKFKKIILIGHSMGGFLSTIVCNKSNGIIKKLILVSPMNSSNYFNLNLLSLIFNYCKFFNIKDTNKKFNNKLIRSFLNFNSFKIMKKNEKELKVPTLIILGKNDKIINFNKTKNIYYNKNMKIINFDNSTHFAFAEETKKYLKELIGFIEE